MMSGRVLSGRQGWMVPRMDVAQYEIIGEDTESTLHVGRIVPIYHETKGWTSRQMRVLVKESVGRTMGLRSLTICLCLFERGSG